MTAPLGVLVTGAGGFIGAALVERLTGDARFRVRAAVRKRSARLPATVEQAAVGDLSPSTDWARALEGMNAAIHLAARAHVLEDRATDPLAEFRRVNVDAAAAFATQAGRSPGFRRLVFVSSIGVNGNATLGRPFRETDTPAPVEPYAVSKYEAEHALQAIAAREGMELTIVRPPLVYGPGAPGNFGRLIELVAKGVPLPFGAVRNRRSFIALDNLVDFLVMAVASPEAANQTFLVSDGEDLSTPDLLRRIARAMGRRQPLVPVPVSLLRAAATALGKRDLIERLVGSLELDASKARQLLAWTPPIGVDDALRRTVVPR